MPRTPTMNAGCPRRIIPPSRISAASAGPSSASTHFSIESPPTSSSPSKAKRTLTGNVALVGQLAHGLDEDEHVPLVVRDSARIEAAVPLRELERGRLPQVERIRRLHVEVRVAEDGRRRLGLPGRRDLADDERPCPPRHELRGPAGAADMARHPLASGDDVRGVTGVRAHGRDGDELGELVAERVGRRHGRAVYAERAGRRADYATSLTRCASASARSFFRPWCSIWRMRSRVTLNARPTSSSVRGCWPSSP